MGEMINDDVGHKGHRCRCSAVRRLERGVVNPLKAIHENAGHVEQFWNILWTMSIERFREGLFMMDVDRRAVDQWSSLSREFR